MNIVLFGKNGQLGKALQKTINLKSISRKEVNFLNSRSINNFFKKNNFDLIINAAAFTNVDKNSMPILSQIHEFFFNEASSIQNGGPEYCRSIKFLNIWWPADELQMIKLF